jgi:hypothetical protein
MEDSMDVDDQHTQLADNKTLQEAGKRKRQSHTSTCHGTWQDLNAQQRRLLGKIDRAQKEGDIKALPRLRAEHGNLLRWEALLTSRDQPPQ